MTGPNQHRRELRAVLLGAATLAMSSVACGAQVLPWPGENLMSYGLSYQAAVTAERLLDHPWIVFAARDQMSSFHDASGTRARHRLEFLQSFYVQDIDLDEGSLHLVHAEIGRSGRLDEAQITKDWGWAKMDDLLLSNRAFQHPDTFVLQRALVRMKMSRSGVVEVPRLYNAPSKNAAVTAELEHTSFFYVYKAWPPKPRRYDPKWGYPWYLVTSEPFLNAAPETSRSPVGRRGFAGWLPGAQVMIWDTRQALEPVIGRSHTAHIFRTSQAALDYAHDVNRTGAAVSIEDTPHSKTWIGQHSRYLMLGQRQNRGQARAEFVAYQGPAWYVGRYGSATDNPHSRLGKAGPLARQTQRLEIFYEGWVATHDSVGERIMTPLLFLTRRETSELVDIAERMREIPDCEVLKYYFRELIDTVSPDDERLTISLLIERNTGFRFRSELLKVPYGDLDFLCHVENAPQFVSLLQGFEEVDTFLLTMVSDDSAAPTNSRKYELFSGDFYWVPMDKLP